MAHGVVTLRFRQGYADIVPQDGSCRSSRLYLGNDSTSWIHFDYLKDAMSPRGVFYMALDLCGIADLYVALDRSTRGRRTLTGGLVLKREEDGEERTYEFSRNEFAEMRRQLTA